MSPAAKPTINPHATPNTPQPRMSVFAKAAVPVFGAIDPAPAVLVRLDEELDLRLLLVLGAGLGQGLPGGVLTGEPDQEHVQRRVMRRAGRSGRVSTCSPAPL